MEKMKKHYEKFFYTLFIIVTTVFLVMAAYYEPSRQTGDTALYAQITDSIARTGKAESNIYANTQDFIDRSIAGMPVETRLQDSKAFMPPTDQSRNILKFHSCFILYLIAPLCYIMSPYACVTLAQSLALALSLLFVILILRDKKIPILLIAFTCLLVTAHPGWSMAAIYGSFYPERLFMGTGLYLAWACEKERFSKGHFVAAAFLCLLVGERGALYAGMFILAHTIFYWKKSAEGRRLKLAVGGVELLYTLIMMKFVLENVYYSDLSGKMDLAAYFSQPSNVDKVVMFLVINLLLFGFIMIFNWRAAVIGMASMVPNLLYDNGGAEKVGWSLHYHVFYFVILIWAVCMGATGLYKLLKKLKAPITLPVTCATAAVCALLSGLITPMGIPMSWGIENLRKNVVYNGPRQIYVMYVLKARQARQSVSNTIKQTIAPEMDVSSIESGMVFLTEGQTIHLFPMGIQDADAAIVTYRQLEDEFVYGGSVVYAGLEETAYFDDAVIDMMKEYGYDFDNAVLCPAYGMAIVLKNDTVQ